MDGRGTARVGQASSGSGPDRSRPVNVSITVLRKPPDAAPDRRRVGRFRVLREATGIAARLSP